MGHKTTIIIVDIIKCRKNKVIAFIVLGDILDETTIRSAEILIGYACNIANNLIDIKREIFCLYKIIDQATIVPCKWIGVDTIVDNGKVAVTLLNTVNKKLEIIGGISD